eukprot:COSAG01_NODE_11268_length_1969_cov_1.871658_2_plen_150_part_00
MFSQSTQTVAYHHGRGKWGEPALAPNTSSSGGKFSPLNLPSQGYMHGDAAYIDSIKQYCIVVMSGGRVRMQDRWRKSILISFSADGFVFSEWQTVFQDNHSSVVYPTLIALEGTDNEHLGNTFAVVYEYRGGNSSSAPFQFNYVNVTVT